MLCRARRLLRPPRIYTRSVASSGTLHGGTDTPNLYCESLVKKHDHEGWLCSYFYPSNVRPAFFALKALFLELAMIPDTVSNVTIGQMRLQFWKDAVASFLDSSKTTPLHPIALALAEAVERFKIQPYHLKRIVDARSSELQNPAHPTIDSLTSHAEATYSTLLYATTALFTDSPSSDVSHAASHLGVAHAMTTLLRGLPFHASRGLLIIPPQITAKHHVRQEDVFRYGGDAKGIDDAVFDFATVANDNLVTAREMLAKAPDRKLLWPVFTPGTAVQAYLSRLESVDFHAFDPSLQSRHWKLPWQMWRNNLRGSF